MSKRPRDGRDTPRGNHRRQSLLPRETGPRSQTHQAWRDVYCADKERTLNDKHGVPGFAGALAFGLFGFALARVLGVDEGLFILFGGIGGVFFELWLENRTRPRP